MNILKKERGIPMKSNYYLDTAKTIKDLVHGYVELTNFELSIIDTAPFQRLKDIRQLTCQQVYPDARHTRFEHSLGVLHLTKLAIDYINKNKFVAEPADLNNCPKFIFNKSVSFNMKLAALLHDVGHCPFSHMGETQLNPLEIKEELYEQICERSDFGKEFKETIESRAPDAIGALHEQISCIMILVHYYDVLSQVNTDVRNSDKLKIDIEFIFRCILGIKYDVSTKAKYEKYRISNIAIELINSKIFDMDKLDYIIRDSFYTGIGTPKIDIIQLFKNMYISSRYNLTFTSKAVPVLQNIIETRDNLYMYVYNHHTVVYSDFIYDYIFRRMRLNAERKKKLYPNENIMIEKGIIPEDYFFTIPSIVDYLYSDADILCALSIQYRLANTEEEYEDSDIERAMVIVKQLFSRQFLKPFWKNLFEFNSFMERFFGSEVIRKNIGQFVCKGGNYGLESSEFCSQLAKHVIYIVKKLNENGWIKEFLDDGDFFVVKRKTGFLSKELIEKLEIHIRKNSVLSQVVNVKYSTDHFYVKYLTTIIPQKDYSSIYDKNAFYIYVKPYNDENSDDFEKKKYYETIENVFAFVAKDFVTKGEQWFVDLFQNPETEEVQSKIKEEMEKLSTKYIEKYKS